MSQRATLAAAALLAAGSSLGCGETVVRSGLAAGDVAEGYDARWRESFLFGTVETEAPEPLAAICPRGWSEVRISASFLSAIAELGTLGIYAPTTVTVVCAAPNGVYMGAPGEIPLAPLCR